MTVIFNNRTFFSCFAAAVILTAAVIACSPFRIYAGGAEPPAAEPLIIER
ncbi:MAG: hypothetical protein LBH00_04220 [Planctomycetaceae bacterium]|jgi:hypothetical protein|nr:hypothetical protein [Planctomycetaceae bacterium]